MKNNLVVLLALLILLVSFFAQNLRYSGLVVQECIDTDKVDVYAKGIIHAGENIVEDACVTEQKMQEFYCTSRGRLRFSIVTCPGGCKDGACVRPSQGPAQPVRESVSLSTKVNKLEINENIGDVVEVLTSRDLDALADSFISTSEGATRYSQFLRFKADSLTSGKVVYAENENDEVGDYLYFKANTDIFEYEVQFEQGFVSEVSNNHLEDLEGKNLEIFGRKYTVIAATKSGDTVELRLLSGSLTETIEEGESKTYTVNGKAYRIELLAFDDQQLRARFKINDREFDTMRKGDTVLVDDLLFGLSETFRNEAGDGPDLARFSLGAEYVILSDNAADNAFSQGVKINGRSISPATVKIKGQSIGSSYKISSIKYRLKADAARGGDIYVPAGHSLREYLDNELGIIGDWDIVYKGLGRKSKGPESIIRLNPSGDDEYRLVFVNNKGDTYNMQFVQNVGGSLKLGDEDDVLHFIESSSSADFKVKQGDWIILSNRNDRGGTTNVLRYSSIDATGKQLHFDDLSTGGKQMTYSGAEGTNAQGDLVVSGNSYRIHVGPAPDYKLAVDLTDDGALNGKEANIVVYGGGIIDLGSTSSPGASFAITLKTEAKQFDEAAADEVISMTIQNTGSGVDVNIPSQAGLSIETENGRTRALSNYGVEFLQQHNGADTLTIKYPSGSQATADVSVVFYETTTAPEIELIDISETEEPEVPQQQPAVEEPASLEPSYKIFEREVSQQQKPSLWSRMLQALLSFFGMQ